MNRKVVLLVALLALLPPSITAQEGPDETVFTFRGQLDEVMGSHTSFLEVSDPFEGVVDVDSYEIINTVVSGTAGSMTTTIWAGDSGSFTLQMADILVTCLDPEILLISNASGGDEIRVECFQSDSQLAKSGNNSPSGNLLDGVPMATMRDIPGQLDPFDIVNSFNFASVQELPRSGNLGDFLGFHIDDTFQNGARGPFDEMFAGSGDVSRIPPDLMALLVEPMRVLAPQFQNQDIAGNILILVDCVEASIVLPVTQQEFAVVNLSSFLNSQAAQVTKSDQPFLQEAGDITSLASVNLALFLTKEAPEPDGEEREAAPPGGCVFDIYQRFPFTDTLRKVDGTSCLQNSFSPDPTVESMNANYHVGGALGDGSFEWTCFPSMEDGGGFFDEESDEFTESVSGPELTDVLFRWQSLFLAGPPPPPAAFNCQVVYRGNDGSECSGSMDVTTCE